MRIDEQQSVRQHDNFAECIQNLLDSKEKTVVFFDLDNTLIITVGYKPNLPRERRSGYGSDIWFSAMCKQIKDSGEYEKLYMLLLSEYFFIQHHAHHMTTEDCVVDCIEKLHQKNIPVFGLTARSLSIAEVTLLRLRELNIRFSNVNSEDIALVAPEKDFPENAVFKQGVIFCSGRSKKTCLHAFSKTMMGSSVFEQAEKIAFLDDKLSHCEDVHTYFVEQKKPAVVMHYTHVERELPVATKEEMAADRARLSENTGVGLCL